MSEHEQHRNREFELLVSRLPREIPPPADLWPRIEAQLSRPSLDALVRELPTDIRPALDLWPRIQSRVVQRRRSVRLAAAAAIVATLSALVISVATRYGGDSTLGENSVASSTAPETTDSSGAAIWWMLQMPPLSGDVAATIQENLGLVRDERLAIEQALEQDPDDAHLRELWAYAYETELRLENEVGKVMVSYERGYGI